MTTNQIILTAGGACIALAAVIYIRKNMAKSNTASAATSAGDGSYPNHSYTVRGYRNNNPLNIRLSSTDWQGQIKPSGDPAFCQFETMAYGYRAAYRNIRTYILAGYKTVQQIISRWAPANENNTSGYITRVCNYTGFTPETVIDYRNQKQMTALVSAMSLVENGTQVTVPESAVTGGWNIYISQI